MNTVDIVLTPADNSRLANLCGSMDSNLNHIARTLSVSIKRRGERFQVCGESAEIAAETIRTLHRKAEKAIALHDIQLCLAEKLPDKSEPQKTAASDKSPFSPKNKNQQLLMEKIQSHDVTICVGPAGTGKTHVALMMALGALKRKEIKKIILARPAVEAGGEKLGFLPGDMEQKVNPYLRPLYDILHFLLGRHEVEKLLARGEIDVIPLAFMRGLTLDNAFVVLDEAQNATVGQVKMVLSRLGWHSKTIIVGDILQSDLPSGVFSGLADAVNRLGHISGIITHEFCDNDIVRNPLVKDILRAYETR